MGVNKKSDSKAVSKLAVTEKRVRVASNLIVILAFIVAVVFAVYTYADANVEKNAQSAATMNSQLSKSITNFLTKLENTAKIVMSQDSYVEYDATSVDNNLNIYNALQLEKEMDSYMTTLSIMDNYNDFGFLYRNNHTVGKITNGTTTLFGEDFYQTLDNLLAGRKNLWLTGYNSDYSRLYYIKRVNNSTVFVSSLFSDELHKVFADSDSVENISEILTDLHGNEIFSVNYNDDAKSAVSNLKSEWSADEVTTAKSFGYTASTIRCGTDWYVTTVIDLSSSNRMYSRIVGFCVLIIFVALAVIFIIRFLFTSSRNPENILYKTEFARATYVDSLTGLSSNEAAENKIADKIETCITGSTIVLLLVSIKNLKLISDNYGEDVSDDALKKVADILKEYYGKKNIVGRTGENEFIVFADFTDFNLFKAQSRLKGNVRQLEAELDRCELDNSRGLIRCAVGASLYPDNSEDYDKLYEQAGKALEISMKTNACKCVFYGELNENQDKKAGEK